MFKAFNSHIKSDFHYFLGELQFPVVEEIKAQLADFNCPLQLKGIFLQFKLFSLIYFYVLPV